MARKSTVNVYDVRDVMQDAKYQELLERYEACGLGEEDLRAQLEKHFENKGKAQELKADIMKAKSKKLEDTEESFVKGEIDDEELERRMDELFRNGDDFLEYEDEEFEDTGPSIGNRITARVERYALPICALMPSVVVLALPLNPMIALVTAPVLLLLGLMLYAVLFLD